MTRKTNPWEKTVEPNRAHAVYQSGNGFTYFVLRSYKHPDSPDIYARWYLMTVSPMTPTGEYGDGYAANIRDQNKRVITNPNGRELHFHVHSEKPGEGQLVQCYDAWEVTLKQAYRLYYAATQVYSYTTLVAELDESDLYEGGLETPQQTATLFTYGSPVVLSLPLEDTDILTRGGQE